MDSLKYNDGKIRLKINDDENRIISFAPDDILFIERYYELIDYLNQKQQEYIDEAKAIDENPDSKKQDGFKLLRKMCEDIKQQIDIVFGEGTSQIVFGDSIRQDMFTQFFIGINEYINKRRAEKIKKYTSKKKNVME